MLFFFFFADGESGRGRWLDCPMWCLPVFAQGYETAEACQQRKAIPKPATQQMVNNHMHRILMLVSAPVGTCAAFFVLAARYAHRGCISWRCRPVFPYSDIATTGPVCLEGFMHLTPSMACTRKHVLVWRNSWQKKSSCASGRRLRTDGANSDMAGRLRSDMPQICTSAYRSLYLTFLSLAQIAPPGMLCSSTFGLFFYRSGMPVNMGHNMSYKRWRIQEQFCWSTSVSI